MTNTFDVFLSYNRQDIPTVRKLADDLRAHGLQVWLDEDYLIPGRPWQKSLEYIIQSTRAVALLIGKSGIGPWEEPEMRGCLSEFVYRKRPVIPVLLPDCPKMPDLPLMLRGFSWVDLRTENSEEGLLRIIWGITGEKPSLRPLNENPKSSRKNRSTSSTSKTINKSHSKPRDIVGLYEVKRDYIDRDRLLKPHLNLPATLSSDELALIPTDLQKRNIIYFRSLSVENVRCFGTKQTLDLSDSNNRPAQWTVILGNNGIGKTTLLQVLANMETMAPWATDEMLSKNFDDFLRTGSDALEVSICLASGEKLTNLGKIFNDITISYILTPKGRNTTNYIPEDSIIIYAYGANRRLSKSRLSVVISSDTKASLFNDQAELTNAEEFLLQTDYSASKISRFQSQHKRNFELIKDILISLLPQVSDIRISIPESISSVPIAEFKTPDGWLRLNALSLGYQTMIAWMVDLAAHMFQRYPDSPNPIAEPAVVLIDEIDLHLHPKWQRTIMSYLSERFVNTQFIVTAHSPLIVQAAENANIAVLKREGDQVIIHQQPNDVKGWRIDQLLTSDLFDLPSARSPHYENLLEKRRQILSKSSLTKADQAELKTLEEEIGDLPTAETAEDIEAMDIIRRAADILKKEP